MSFSCYYNSLCTRRILSVDVPYSSNSHENAEKHTPQTATTTSTRTTTTSIFSNLITL